MSIPMQYLIVEAVQDPAHRHDKEYGGATVGCWIKDKSESEARQIARAYIERYGWTPLTIMDQHPVTEEMYMSEAAGYQYYEQALIDNEVFVFHTFPRGARA